MNYILQCKDINTLQAIKNSPPSIRLERVHTPILGNIHFKVTNEIDGTITR